MNLRKAAAYFARTEILGWNGTGWDSEVAFGAVDPFDRFVSEREFGSKRRYLLVDPTSPLPEEYTVIRAGAEGPVYMVGRLNQDIQVDPYSHVHLVAIAPETVELVELETIKSASGVASRTVEESFGEFFCDLERIAYANTREYGDMRYTEFTLTMPSDTPLKVNQEILWGDQRYVVLEAYSVSGFMQGRVMLKGES